MDTGYWSLVYTPKVLKALPMVPKPYDAPAIPVSVAKSASANDGEVPTFFARYWGIVSRPMQATAVAGLSSPSTILPGGVFPLAIAQCLYDNYWNFNTTPAGPKLDPATGKPDRQTDNLRAGSGDTLDAAQRAELIAKFA